ncbi:MAG TPA: hypothetical protein VKE51_34710 [Vicinamibacterales bacterium]|nr:hypothetical protein [Vicinamibacterales bacterium]
MSDLGATVEITLRTREAYNAAYDAILEALHLVFEGKILPDAKELSPVGHEPLKGEHFIRNRESLKVNVFGTRRGPFAKLYSTSGHGGFLELGTIHMSAQPYVWPAFQMNLGNILLQIKESLSGPELGELGRVVLQETER